MVARERNGLEAADTGVLLTFLRVVPGKEESVWGELSRFRGVFPYKQLGYFDVLCVSNLDTLAPNLSHFRIPGVSQVLQVRCIAWAGERAPLPPKAEDFAKHPLLAVQFLRIDFPIPSAFELQQHLVRRIMAATLGKVAVTGVYTGLGLSEVVVLFAGDDVSQIMKLSRSILDLEALEEANASKKAYFSQSTTLFHISYPLVLQGRDFSKIRGGVLAEFFASVDLTQETQAKSNWPTAFGEPIYVFGPFDWKGHTNRETPLSTIVEEVWDLRRRWLQMPVFLDTVTLLQTSSYEPRQVEGGGLEVLQRQRLASVDVVLDQAEEESKKVVSLLGEADTLSVRLLDYLGAMREIVSDRRARAAIYDLEPYLRFLASWLRRLLAAYNAADYDAAQFAHVQRTKAEIAQSLIIATKALQQRYPNAEVVLQGRPARAAVSTHLGLNRLILAMGAVPRFLYESARRSSGQRAYRWSGFVAFGDEYQFSRWPAEAITCPTDALWDPLATWYVLTHEVAHGISSLILGSIDSEGLQQSETEVVKAVSGSSGEAVFAQQEVMTLVDEVIAHWIDLECFYEGDVDMLLKLMWKGWARIPRVWWNTTTYQARSLLLSSYYEADDLLGMSPQRSLEHLTDRARGLLLMLEPFVLTELGAGALQALDRSAERAARLSMKFLPITAFLLEQRSRLGVYRQRFQATDAKRLENETRSIAAGRPILDGLSNPLRLLLDLTKADMEPSSAARRWRANIALVYSLADDHLARLSE